METGIEQTGEVGADQYDGSLPDTTGVDGNA